MNRLRTRASYDARTVPLLGRVPTEAYLDDRFSRGDVLDAFSRWFVDLIPFDAVFEGGIDAADAGNGHHFFFSSALDASLTFMFEDSRIFLRVSVDIRCDIIDMLMDEIGASVYSRG